MQGILKSHGRPHATLHSFRRAFNNALRDLGLALGDRQALLAHASSDTTLIYTSRNLELARRYVDQIPEGV
jgi:integrase